MALNHVQTQDQALIDEIVTAIAGATAVFDSQQKLVAANEAFIELWQFQSLDDALGIVFKDLWQGPLNHDYSMGPNIDFSGKLVGITQKNNAKDIHVTLRQIREAADLPNHHFMAFRDVSDQEQLVEALIDSEMHIKAIMDNAAVGIATVNEYGAIESFNKKAEQIFGYTAHDLTGHNWTMLVPLGHREQNIEDFSRYVKTGHCDLIGTGPRERTGLRQDGTEFPMEIAFAEVALDGKKTVIGSFLDISEKKQAEQQLRQAQKIQAIGQLTGGIAHDFNNLLSSLALNLNMIADERNLSPDMEAFVDSVGHTLQRGTSLTERLLNFSRRQAAKAEPLCANDPIDDVVSLMQRTSPGHTTINADLADNLWCTEADAHEFENALLNLCINARDAMPDGGEILIKSRNLSINALMAYRYDNIAPGEYVQVTLTDTGIGMSSATSGQATEPFFTTKKEGTGLGLAMVHGFVRQSGGHLHIKSTLGQGTRIELLFPRLDDSQIQASTDHLEQMTS